MAVDAARQLIEAGSEVAFLALLDAYGPGFPRRRGLFERSLSRRAVTVRPRLREKVASLSTRLVRGRRTEPTADPATERAARLIHESRTAYLRDLRSYPGRITLFCAAETIRSDRFSYDDPTLGWGSVARGGVEVLNVPGNHLSMLDPAYLPDLAHVMRTTFAILGESHAIIDGEASA